jgi:hypothetical protein
MRRSWNVQRRVDERRVHPQLQIGVVAGVALAADGRVDAADLRRDPPHLLRRAVGGDQQEVQRAEQAGEGTVGEVAVLGHPARHGRMGQLHQQGPPRGEADERLGRQRPQDVPVTEQGVEPVVGTVAGAVGGAAGGTADGVVGRDSGCGGHGTSRRSEPAPPSSRTY